MSAGYSAVQWSAHKRVYDACVAGAILLYLVGFALVSRAVLRGEHALSPEILAIRATGSCAIVLLHVILCIGPLARFDRRFLPLLYNRRHLGVMTFIVALVHAAIVLGFYHGFGRVNPLASLLTSSGTPASFVAFPFEWLGAGALLIMFLMAATSHDFWLKNLSARTWKSLHMLVYAAYALLVGHVALGALQGDRSFLAPTLVGTGLVLVCALHIAAGVRERGVDAGRPVLIACEARPPDSHAPASAQPGWIDAGDPDSIPMDRARIVRTPRGERIALFRHKDGFSALTNVCAHQGGPLGEGKVIDGCVTCPWHGWQYRPGDGCSPPPFQEKVSTYDVRISGGRVQVRSSANPPGTPVIPAPATEPGAIGSTPGEASAPHA